MPIAELFGYMAGACLLLMASMKTQSHMRLCNIAGNACFIVYGFLNGLMPVLLLNSIILVLHIYRLLTRQMPKPTVAK